MTEISAANTSPLSHASMLETFTSPREVLNLSASTRWRGFSSKSAAISLVEQYSIEKFVFQKGVSDEVVLNVDVLSPGT